MTDFEKRKKALSDEYAEAFYGSLKKITADFKDKLNALLGDEYVAAAKRYDEVLSEQKSVKSEFLNSAEYLNAKKTLENARLAAETAGDINLNEANKVYRNALFDMAAVNAKLNNKLKKTRSEADEIKDKLKNEFFLRKKELNALKDDAGDEIRAAISACIIEYNKRLKELCESCGVKYEKTEYPFDASSVEGITATGKLESDLYFYISDEAVAFDDSEQKQSLSENEGARTMIACDNDSDFKN